MSIERFDNKNQTSAAGAKRLLVAAALDARHAEDGAAEICRAASQLDAAGIDLLLLAGAESGLDPLILAGWLVTRTRRVGLVSTLPALHSIPFHVARALSTLDFLSRGRSGWAPTTLGHAAQAEAIGPKARIDDDRALEKAADFIAATEALWDSWDASALIVDKASGIYLDADRVRRVHYRGPWFQTMGPLNSPRPPQGYPVMVQHDADPLWESMAARAEVVIVHGSDRMTLTTRRTRITQAGGNARILAAMDPTAPDAVDHLEAMFDADIIDGVHFAASNSADLSAMMRDILPELTRRGLMRPSTQAGSLRFRLGLPDQANSGPAHRFLSATAA